MTVYGSGQRSYYRFFIPPQALRKAALSSPDAPLSAQPAFGGFLSRRGLLPIGRLEQKVLGTAYQATENSAIETAFLEGLASPPMRTENFPDHSSYYLQILRLLLEEITANRSAPGSDRAIGPRLIGGMEALLVLNPPIQTLLPVLRTQLTARYHYVLALKEALVSTLGAISIARGEKFGLEGFRVILNHREHGQNKNNGVDWFEPDFNTVARLKIQVLETLSLMKRHRFGDDAEINALLALGIAEFQNQTVRNRAAEISRGQNLPVMPQKLLSRLRPD